MRERASSGRDFARRAPRPITLNRLRPTRPVRRVGQCADDDLGGEASTAAAVECIDHAPATLANWQVAPYRARRDQCRRWASTRGTGLADLAAATVRTTHPTHRIAARNPRALMAIDDNREFRRPHRGFSSEPHRGPIVIATSDHGRCPRVAVRIVRDEVTTLRRRRRTRASSRAVVSMAAPNRRSHRAVV